LEPPSILQSTIEGSCCSPEYWLKERKLKERKKYDQQQRQDGEDTNLQQSKEFFVMCWTQFKAYAKEKKFSEAL
jgi:hypothetical protein